jgi:hypothetical protein
MSWVDLEPIVKHVPLAQAYIHVNADGLARVHLFLSEAFLNGAGKPTAANVQLGEFDGLVKMRLVFTNEGRFKIHSLGRGGSRINNIPAKAPVPDGARETEPCVVESYDKESAIITLPLKAWAAQLIPTVTIPPAATKITASPPPAATLTGPEGKLNAVEYLRRHGTNLIRVGDAFKEGNETHSKASVLTMINRCRRAAMLPDIRMVDFY